MGAAQRQWRRQRARPNPLNRPNCQAPAPRRCRARAKCLSFATVRQQFGIIRIGRLLNAISLLRVPAQRSIRFALSQGRCRGAAKKRCPHLRARRVAASWRSGYAEDCKSLHPGSIPGEASSALFIVPDFHKCRNVGLICPVVPRLHTGNPIRWRAGTVKQEAGRSSAGTQMGR